MKTLKQLFFTLVILSIINAPVYSQNIFVENFNYPVRDSLEGIGGWDRSGVNSIFNIKVTSPGLTYSGYLGSGIGNCVSFSNQTDGDICLNVFNKEFTGAMYMSLLIRVDSFTTNATEGYNICFNPSNSTNLNTKPYVKKLTTATFNFGIRKSFGTTQYAAGVYSKNVTYLVVVKYFFVAGDNNDTAKIYVFNSGVPVTEPAAPTASDVTGDDIFDISQVGLTNSYAQGGLLGSPLRIDGIRIGKTWASTLLTTVNLQLNLTALIEGFYDNVSNKMIKDTARVYLRNSAATYSIADSSKAIIDSTGKGIFLFNKIGNFTPYYIVLKHRNSMETWSSNVPSFFSNSMSYDFTTGLFNAYGNNLVQKGSKFCIYGGDVNQDGIVELFDLSEIDNGVFNFTFGYVNADVTGDNFVDLSDYTIADNNAFNFVSIKRP